MLLLMFFKSQKNQPAVSPHTQPPPQQIQSSISKQKISIPFKEVKTIPLQNIQGTNLLQEHYVATIQDPVDQSDETIALVMHLQPLPNEKKRFLQVQNLSTYILNYGGTDLPAGIQLCCMELTGVIQNGSSTNIIAISRPFQISTTQNTGGFVGFTATYKSEINPLWQITNVNTLTFKIKLQGEVTWRSLPTAQPLSTSIKITRVIY